ncbi:1-acyl-sn-glycerol-3-phosphate acyltransferase [Capnocytophaga sp.]|uniref:1-acyl-sn-glycerol-3-phosphate acyltransferase n=1 Tax=Capnocytophaga sp. TaxID=44737 RepID=UPI0026DC25C9|nr:1-acyl-sn-glycerol-3-phosphate acyltransferase [Capnocytophaga sp.]MDO5105461.1 1-acyl-sn-glycerol-3-phosphate acyltransferase [Capnocytophaga sp.]
MKKIIGTLVLKLLGWKIVLEGDVNNLNRCVLVVAPHTCNFEYLLGNMVYWKFQKPLRVIIKDAHTKAWYGFIIKWLGGIGINRSQRNNLVQFVTELFEKEDFSLVITPEGTRSRVAKWKLGFYHMALGAKVPLVLAGPDFKTKKIHIGKIISVQDLENRSFEEIMSELEAYYNKFTPRYPEKWNPKIY